MIHKQRVEKRCTQRVICDTNEELLEVLREKPFGAAADVRYGTCVRESLESEPPGEPKRIEVNLSWWEH